jgi:uncharacterized alkaline shock family protein YloU
MEATPVISSDVLARYAGDAAREVEGVSALTSGAVEVTESVDKVDVVVHIELEWGAGANTVGRDVQERVAEYLGRMANLDVGSVDVVVERAGAPPAKQ